MQVEACPVTALVQDPANVRVHGEENILAIMSSLRRFGQQKPVVIDGNNVVRAGNGTLAAARRLGWPTVMVVRTALAGADAVAYAIADNRTAELAQWDDAALRQQLGALEQQLQEAAGFSAADLAKLSAEEPELQLPEPEEKAIPEAYEVAVRCDDENDQQALYQRLTSEGRTCRLLTM